VVSLVASFSVVGLVLVFVVVEQLIFGLGLSGAEIVEEASWHWALHLYRKVVCGHEMLSPAIYSNLEEGLHLRKREKKI
jgi:hypothetical protein